VNPLLHLPLGKVVFVVAWVALGVFLVRRGNVRRGSQQREREP